MQLLFVPSCGNLTEDEELLLFQSSFTALLLFKPCPSPLLYAIPNWFASLLWCMCRSCEFIQCLVAACLNHWFDGPTPSLRRSVHKVHTHPQFNLTEIEVYNTLNKWKLARESSSASICVLYTSANIVHPILTDQCCTVVRKWWLWRWWWSLCHDGHDSGGLVDWCVSMGPQTTTNQVYGVIFEWSDWLTGRVSKPTVQLTSDQMGKKTRQREIIILSLPPLFFLLSFI